MSKWIIGALAGFAMGVLLYNAYRQYMLDAKNAQG